MFYHIITTPECNLQCRYCFGKTCDEFNHEINEEEYDYNLPVNISYDIETLKKFCNKDPKPTLTFYGGEPLLRIEYIKNIMDNIKARYMIQTNGLLLNKLPKNYINRFHTILVSIDGDKSLTEKNRGKGTYQKILSNIKLIKEQGYAGEIIARMTIDEETNIYKAVTHLINTGFASIHWQIDAMFWEGDYEKRNFGTWVKNNYNPNITKLIKHWISKMEQGEVLKLYPFLDITYDLLYDNKTKLRCGAGWINFTILTDGHIAPCPIMGGMKKYYLGHIKQTNPNELKDSTFVKEPCTSCKYLNKCGGRCLYANITKFWPDKGHKEVCSTIIHLIEELENNLPKIKDLIRKKTISLKDFDHTKYNGCEIIP